MPVYTYRREDGTTFELRQRFSDPALTTDPQTGQAVVRVVHAAGVIFKGSGFYVNDSKSASKSATTTPPRKDAAEAGASSDTAAPAAASTPAAESKPAAPAAKPAATPAAD
jgi:putative FmdB family regulatory protein